MPPPIDWTTPPHVFKDGVVVDSARVSGMAVEQYFNLCFAIGANSVTTGAFPDTLRVRLDRLGERDLLLPERERHAAMTIGSDIRQRLFMADYCVLQANAPVRVGGAKVGEHDLVVDVPCCPMELLAASLWR